MEKLLNAVKSIFCIIIGILFALIFAIGYLIFLPFDIIRYHRMPYYRDLKKKFHIFITSNDIVKFYNHAVKKKFPIQYFENQDTEYFILGDIVLLCGWSYEGFEQVDGEWYFRLDGECQTTLPMADALAEEKELLLPEHREMDAKFLIFYNDVTDADQFEKAKTCPYFYCICAPDEAI